MRGASGWWRSSVWCLALGLASCGASDLAELPVSQAPPVPVSLTSAFDVLVLGYTNEFYVEGLPSGATLELYATGLTGGAVLCPDILDGECLDLPQSARLVASQQVNSGGTATFSLSVREGLSLTTGYLQVAGQWDGFLVSDTLRSNVLSLPAMLGRGDPDRDSVSTWYEVSVAGTDPLDPDSDGAGQSDGEELREDGTDPLDPFDDVEDVFRDHFPFGPCGGTPTISQGVYGSACIYSDTGPGYTASGTVELRRPGGAVLQTVDVDSRGFFEFEIVEGDYRLCELGYQSCRNITVPRGRTCWDYIGGADDIWVDDCGR